MLTLPAPAALGLGIALDVGGAYAGYRLWPAHPLIGGLLGLIAGNTIGNILVSSA